MAATRPGGQERPSDTASSGTEQRLLFTARGVPFELDAKYNPLDILGEGAYGTVISALDTSSGKRVAIKKIPRAFEDLVDAKRVLREVRMMRHFNHPNVRSLVWFFSADVAKVVRLLDLIHPPSLNDFDDLYLVSEFMETDLRKIIMSENTLTDDHIQFFVYQILCGLRYMHSAQVVHRDLKPSNLLLNSDCELKLADLGLARGIDDPDDALTEYVVTRWYRAPEVMCSVQDYDYKIDVWAVGCIMAELLGRKALFPGKDYINQLECMMDVLGTPSEEDMAFMTNKNARNFINTLPPRPRKTWASLFPQANPLAIDLLDKMLQFSPQKRISVEDCLKHPYFEDLMGDLDNHEYLCKTHLDLSFERIPMTKVVLQKLFLYDITLFRPWAVGLYESEEPAQSAPPPTPSEPSAPKRKRGDTDSPDAVPKKRTKQSKS